MTSIPAPGADLATDELKERVRFDAAYQAYYGDDLTPQCQINDAWLAMPGHIWRYARTSFAAVPASAPVVGEKWHVRYKGGQTLATIIVDEVTAATVVIASGDFPSTRRSRYAWADLTFVERVSAAPAPVSGMPDLASLQRHDLVEHQHGSGHMVYWDKSMDEESDGEWVKFADVERLLNPTGEKK